MAQSIGRMTYEGRYVIVTVPEGWRESDSLPPSSPSDLWFDKLPDFLAALNGPWDHIPIKRRPWATEDEAVPVCTKAG